MYIYYFAGLNYTLINALLNILKQYVLHNTLQVSSKWNIDSLANLKKLKFYVLHNPPKESSKWDIDTLAIAIGKQKKLCLAQCNTVKTNIK